MMRRTENLQTLNKATLTLIVAGQEPIRSSSSTSTTAITQTTHRKQLTSISPGSQISMSTTTVAVESPSYTTTEAESQEAPQEKSITTTTDKPPCVDGKLADSSQEKHAKGRVWSH